MNSLSIWLKSSQRIQKVIKSLTTGVTGPYNEWFILFIFYCKIQDYFFRFSCEITDVKNDRVIITGGGFYQTERVVHMYNESGYVGDLAMLKHGRQDHACTSYVADDGSTVDI